MSIKHLFSPLLKKFYSPSNSGSENENDDTNSPNEEEVLEETSPKSRRISEPTKFAKSSSAIFSSSRSQGNSVDHVNAVKKRLSADDLIREGLGAANSCGTTGSRVRKRRPVISSVGDETTSFIEATNSRVSGEGIQIKIWPLKQCANVAFSDNRSYSYDRRVELIK